MNTEESRLSLYVKVDCDALSQHRTPEGIYQVDIIPEKSLTHSASSAMQVIRDHVAFMSENEDTVSMSVYDADGIKIPLLSSVDPFYADHGCFNGRAVQYPETINLH